MIFDCTSFEWDKGNHQKNWNKHKVSQVECEELFFNQPLLIHNDVRHSKQEERFYALGQTNLKRKLFIAFTVRNQKIRVISARDMSQKEKKLYEKKSPEI